MCFIDIHSHNREALPNVLKVVNIFPYGNIFPHPSLNISFSAGIHPWHINEFDLETSFEVLEGWLDDGLLAAIGETGLDASVNINEQLQREVFKRHVQLSENHQLPLVIHCVRRYQELIQIKKEMKATQTWILHGFHSSVELMTQLMQQNICFSIGSRLLNHQSKMQKVYQNIPDQFLFVESDDKDTPVEIIYKELAVLRHTSLDSLKKIIYTNYLTIFKP